MIALVFLLGLIVYFGVSFATNAFLGETEKKPAEVSVECTQYGVDHQVIAQSNTMSPTKLNAKLCDSITITNKDNKSRKFSFGEHDDHVTYAGFTEKIVPANGSLNFVLNKTGSYIIHDHYQEEVELKFVVSQ